MEKDTIFYLYITWHASIFDFFCGILHQLGPRYEVRWKRYFSDVRWSRAPLNFFVNRVYAHIDIPSTMKIILIL